MKVENIEEWSSKHEAEVQENDAPIEEIQNRIKELRERENEERKENEDQIEEEPLQWRYDVEKQLEIMKIQLQQTFERNKQGKSTKRLRGNRMKVKLQKLIISRFESTCFDWLRFWSQFETKIDRADITTASKFSYLKELVIPKDKNYFES